MFRWTVITGSLGNRKAMSLAAKAKAREIAGKITEALGGRGIFGVELFIKGDDVIFSEVSPSARYRNGDDDYTGFVSIRFARPCGAWLADP